MQFVGTPARYKIRVHNLGDAPAKNAKLIAKLPTGVKFVSGSDGAVLEPPSKAATWAGPRASCRRANSGNLR